MKKNYSLSKEGFLIISDDKGKNLAVVIIENIKAQLDSIERNQEEGNKRIEEQKNPLKEMIAEYSRLKAYEK